MMFGVTIVIDASIICLNKLLHGSIKYWVVIRIVDVNQELDTTFLVLGEVDATY